MSTDVLLISTADSRKRWSTLIVLSLGVLMIALDSTVVYVALPSIRENLNLGEASLSWVVNAFTLTYSGFLLLAGRLGDYFGHRRLFLGGIALFTLASVACGLANTAGLVVAGRAAQGLAGAFVSTVAMSLIMDMFPDSVERAKATGIYILIYVCGGSVGLLLGGVLTSALSWHWIFLVNVPVGVAVYLLCSSRLPQAQERMARTRLDVWGAVTLTGALVLGIYAIVNGDHAHAGSSETLWVVACAAVFLVAFVIIESIVVSPLMPLRFFMAREILVSNVVRVLWAAGASSSFFVALYMQLVLGHGPMQVGLTFLPANLVLAGMSLGLSAKVVTRFGIKWPLCAGLALGAIGMALLARMPVHGDLMIDVVPGTILVAISAGLASIPLLFATLNGVAPGETGLASGVISTVTMMGNAFGLAILVSLASVRTENLLTAGTANAAALTGGYRLAFIVAAGCAVSAALISAVFLRGNGVGAGVKPGKKAFPTQF